MAKLSAMIRRKQGAHHFHLYHRPSFKDSLNFAQLHAHKEMMDPWWFIFSILSQLPTPFVSALVNPLARFPGQKDDKPKDKVDDGLSNYLFNQG